MEKKHVIIVEDETIIALDIKQCLERFGYIVDEVTDNATDALFLIKKYLPNIVLMDIKLQGEFDGTQIVEQIQNEYNIPVVYLTSHTDSQTLQKVQKTKPYGYVIKPFDENQLYSTLLIALSRFEAEEKNFSSVDTQIIRINKEYSYHCDTKKLFYKHKEIPLTKRESELFGVLAKKLNSIVSIEFIIQTLRKDKAMADTTIRSLVRRVREKIQDDLIESFMSKGYRLKGDDEKR